MPQPPRGFKAEMYPLRHDMFYSAGLPHITTAVNTTIFTFVRNYKGANNPDTINVNPHHASFKVETGSVCAPMSIIDRLSMTLRFTYTKNGFDERSTLKAWWQPIFFSFPEKLDAADDETSTTVASLLGLLKDATQEDVTPLFNNTKFSVLGTSDRSHPVATANLTETFGILNMDTDLTMEGVTYDDDTVQSALRYYTNKGALRACLGRRRFVTLGANHPHQNFHIRKFVPRAVRRIMPYGFFGIIVHAPLVSDDDQYYQATSGSASIATIGVQCKVRYDEWNSDHLQEMM